MYNILDILGVLFYSVSAIYFSIRFFLKKEKARTPAFLFLLLGFLVHALNLMVFSFEHHRFPGANLAEASSSLTFLMVLPFIFISRKQEMDAAAMILLPVAVGSILFLAFVPSEIQTSEPVVRGGWIYIHIPLMILSVAALSISSLMAIMYLVQEKQLKSRHPAFFLERLPSLEVCEELSYRSLWFGFFLLTFGIVTGMIWSKYLRGMYWSWDYKEIWSMITWCLYAALIHGRMLSAWRGRKAAYLAILGFVFILFAFAGVSLVFKSYHTF